MEPLYHPNCGAKFDRPTGLRAANYADRPLDRMFPKETNGAERVIKEEQPGWELQSSELRFGRCEVFAGDKA